MRRLIFSVFLCSAYVFSTNVSAQNNLPEFKGFYFGKTTYEEWRSVATEYGEIYGKNEQVAPYCKEDGSFGHLDKPDLGIKTCSWYKPGFVFKSLSVGQAPTNHDTWTFIDGTLESFTATLYVGQMNNLLPPLETKYGSPTSVITSEIQNTFGVNFTNEIRFWLLDEMSITVSKYAGRVDTSAIIISNPELANEKERRINSETPDTSGL